MRRCATRLHAPPPPPLPHVHSPCGPRTSSAHQPSAQTGRCLARRQIAWQHTLRSCPPFCGAWEGEELTRTAQETFDSRARAVTSRPHAALVWAVLRCARGAAKQFENADPRVPLQTEWLRREVRAVRRMPTPEAMPPAPPPPQMRRSACIVPGGPGHADGRVASCVTGGLALPRGHAAFPR